MRLFGDSSAWLPFFDRSEPQHRALRQAFSDLARRRLVIYVTDYILDETLTLILARAGHSTAVAGGDWLLHSEYVRLVQIDSDQWHLAWDMFRHYDDKRFSFTDCTSFVVMQQYHLIDALTLDHHFEQMGFRPWPQ
jgi:predicted nucleic acid-binding protein